MWKRIGIKIKENYSKRTLIVILCLMAISIVPRGIELLNHNYLFGYDQGQAFLEVKKIVVDKKLTLIGTEVGGQGGFFQAPGWYYLLSIPFIMTDGDPYGGMVIMFLIGLSTIVFSTLFAKDIFDLKTAAVIGFLIAISPAMITHARFIWAPFPIPLITVFFIFFLYKALQKKEKFVFLALFALGLMSHFEIATAATLLLQFLLFSPVLLINRLISVRIFFLSIFGFILALSPLIFFDLRHDLLNTRGIIDLIFGKSSVVNHPMEWILKNHFEVFSSNFFSTFNLGSMLWPLLIFIMILGSVWFITDKKNKLEQKILLFYLAVSPIILFIVSLIYKQGMWLWWILELHIFYSFLLGICFMQFWKKKIFKPLVAAIVFVFFVSFLNQTINFYRNDFNDFGGIHKIKGKLQAIDFIYNNAKSKKFGLIIFSPTIYTYPYDYLIWWYGRKKYGYIPYKEKKGTFYLLIEPDPYKPWSHEGWLETFIKVGKVVETKKLPSGFIVQKRVMED